MRRTTPLVIALALVAALLLAGCASGLLLPDGRVLFMDMVGKVYDPATGRVTNAARPGSIRVFHSASLLQDGRVLVVGGLEDDVTLATAEIYDPVTDAWSPTGRLASPRALHVSVVLKDGRVLVTGGTSDGDRLALTAADGSPLPFERYDPETGTFDVVAVPLTPRVLHTASLLTDGRVLLAGGVTTERPIAAVEIHDPVTGTSTSTGPLTMPRAWHTATVLADGRVLFVGGTGTSVRMDGPDTEDITGLATEILDPATGTFTEAGRLGTPRTGHAATLLQDGRVLITGGLAAGGEQFLVSAEIIDPATGVSTPTGDMTAPKALHAAVLLPDGRVVVSGWDSTGAGGPAELRQADPFASADVYDPVSGTFTALEVDALPLPLWSPPPDR